jgi:hypothetical protein
VSEPPDRRPSSDTLRLRREEIDGLIARHNTTPPPSVQAAIAEAQGIPGEVCAACGGEGLVSPRTNARVRLALPRDPVDRDAVTQTEIVPLPDSDSGDGRI